MRKEMCPILVGLGWVELGWRGGAYGALEGAAISAPAGKGGEHAAGLLGAHVPRKGQPLRARHQVVRLHEISATVGGFKLYCTGIF